MKGAKQCSNAKRGSDWGSDEIYLQELPFCGLMTSDSPLKDYWQIDRLMSSQAGEEVGKAASDDGWNWRISSSDITEQTTLMH